MSSWLAWRQGEELEVGSADSQSLELRADVFPTGWQRAIQRQEDVFPLARELLIAANAS